MNNAEHPSQVTFLASSGAGERQPAAASQRPRKIEEKIAGMLADRGVANLREFTKLIQAGGVSEQDSRQMQTLLRKAQLMLEIGVYPIDLQNVSQTPTEVSALTIDVPIVAFHGVLSNGDRVAEFALPDDKPGERDDSVFVIHRRSQGMEWLVGSPACASGVIGITPDDGIIVARLKQSTFSGGNKRTAIRTAICYLRPGSTDKVVSIDMWDAPGDTDEFFYDAATNRVGRHRRKINEVLVYDIAVGTNRKVSLADPASYVWQHVLGVTRDDFIIATTRRRHMHFVDARTGKPVYTHETPYVRQQKIDHPILPDGSVLLFDNDLRLLRWDPRRAATIYFEDQNVFFPVEHVKVLAPPGDPEHIAVLGTPTLGGLPNYICIFDRNTGRLEHTASYEPKDKSSPAGFALDSDGSILVIDDNTLFTFANTEDDV